MTRTDSLRRDVLRGGAYLTVRQGLGTAINVGGVLLLTRTLGPGDWGIYAGASALLVALQLVAPGISVFLLRREVEPEETVWRAASTLMLAVGVAGFALGMATIPLVAAWTRMELIGAVAVAVFATLPVTNLSQVALARLERALDFRRIAWIELTGQGLFFAVSIPLAFAAAGPWAPVAGYAAQQVALLVLAHAAAGYLPRPLWDRSVVKEAMGYGAGFTASIWIYQLRRTANPLIVGRYLGAEAVGIVALTAQIVTHLSFVALATWRLSMAALGRVQAEPERLRRAVSDGMRLQAVAVAPFLLGFAWLAPLVVPPLLGAEWSAISGLYPFLAIGALANAVFNLESSALYVLRRNREMALFHIVQTGLLMSTAVVLVPRIGLIGYGLAELVALASYAVLHVYTSRAIGSPATARPLSLSTAVALALGYPYLGVWTLAGLAVTVAVLRPWRELAGLLPVLRGTRA